MKCTVALLVVVKLEFGYSRPKLSSSSLLATVPVHACYEQAHLSKRAEEKARGNKRIKGVRARERLTVLQTTNKQTNQIKSSRIKSLTKQREEMQAHYQHTKALVARYC